MKIKIKHLLFGQIPFNNISGNIAFLLIRLTAGITIMYAGLDKLPLTDWMVDQVTELGFPFPVLFAWLATFSEFAFGLLLALGLFTRISGLMLSITMGVAAFGFHKVFPIVDMHITQYLFWIFILFFVWGGGKYSLDNLLIKNSSKLSIYIPFSLFSLILLSALYIELSSKSEVVAERPQISSISVVGSFNGWDPSESEMNMLDSNKYSLELMFDKAQIIKYKFTANKSWDINFGEIDQTTQRFPVKGIVEQDNNGTTKNIEAYIPNAGMYLFLIDLENNEYSLDSLNFNLEQKSTGKK